MALFEQFYQTLGGSWVLIKFAYEQKDEIIPNLTRAIADYETKTNQELVLNGETRLYVEGQKEKNRELLETQEI